MFENCLPRHQRFSIPASIRIVALFSCALLSLSALASGSLGQNTQDTSNKADQNLTSSARINPVTLAMEFSLPLGSYRGRGGHSIPVVFSYSSKVWTAEGWSVRRDGHDIPPNGGQTYEVVESTDTFPTFGQYSTSGWTSSLGSPAIVEESTLYNQDGGLISQDISSTLSGLCSSITWHEGCRVIEAWYQRTSQCTSGWAIVVRYQCEDVPEDPPESLTEGTMWDCVPTPTPMPTVTPNPTPTPPPAPTPTPEVAHKVERLTIKMPDGSSKEFRVDDKICNVGTGDGCTHDNPNLYFSVDGSAMRFKKNEEVSGLGARDVLYLPNGSRYVFAQSGPVQNHYRYAEFLIDSNGNRSEFKSSERKWIDNTGREIVDPLAITTQDFNLQGIGGQGRTHHLTWKRLHEVFDDPQQTQTKYLGDDTCQSVNNTPMGGGFLFKSDEPVITVNGNVRYQSTLRACASFFGDTPSFFDPFVLSQIRLPDGSTYKFTYNEYGEIVRIVYPTGAYERFEYDRVSPLGFVASDVYAQTNRGVIKRLVSVDGLAETQEWKYTETKTTAPDGSRTERVIHRSTNSGFGFDDPRAGMVMEEKSFDTNGGLRSRTLNEWTTRGPRGGTHAHAGAARDPRLERSLTIVFEPGSTSALATLTVNEYDDTGSTDPEFFSHLNLKRTKSYHYATLTKSQVDDEPLDWDTTIAGWFPQSKIAAAAQTDYVYDTSYKARGILGLPIRTLALDPATLDANQPLARSEVVYDNSLPSASGNYNYSMQTYGSNNSMDCSSDQNPKICWQNPNGPSGAIDLSYRGLPTTTRVWHAEAGSWIETHTRYDQFGNAVATKDPTGNESTTEYSAAYKHAYPTKVTAFAPDPSDTHGTNLPSQAETVYDLWTGLPLSVTDDFGQVSTTEYDNMLRPKRVNPVVVNGNPTGPVTETVYGTPDATSGQLPAGERFVKVRKQIDANNWDEATTWFDGLGRAVKTQAKDSQGDVFVETAYDNFGRVERVSNPYRSGETVYWSKTRYDEAGRGVESYAPATIADINSSNLVSLGITSFDISTVTNFVGTVVTTTDASGRKGRSVTNALGQLLRVDEPTATGGTEATDLGSLAAPHQPTIYTYDAYGKMVRVQQGVQNRYFKYDSLGRLIRVNQPEQEFSTALTMSDEHNPTWHWTAGFAYDALGNVVRATDANGVNIINEYDRASRVVRRCYTRPNVYTTATACSQIASGDLSTDTPTVQNFYDGKGLAQQQSPNYAKGKLTKVDNGISSTEYMTFDNFGRLTRTKQTTGGVEYGGGTDPSRWMTYTYNFSGALIEERLPSGRVVKNEFESDGDLRQVASRNGASQVFVPYASNFSYTASGGISQMRLGNGRWETAKFNTRSQVTEIGLGATASDAGTWKVNYDYGELNTDGTTVDAAKNTGNIAKQTLTIPGTSFVQNYRYDPLYRITEARETTGTNQNWIQNWTYDRYGNRLTFAQNIMGSATNTTPAIDSNTNRFVTTGTNFQYDLNGNLIHDADNRQFKFNGDNKQAEVKDANGVLVGKYFYDGEGKRVKKQVYDATGLVTEETVFVYSSGKLVAEYSTTPASQPSVNFTTTDHLGSPRVITNGLGQIKSRRDFMPFGEDVASTVGSRSTNTEYAAGDDLRQKFTGYQKDGETGLDFAEARMYENRHGRFTAVDPLLASGNSANPQTFNRYVYVGNNPMNVVDPYGLEWYTKKDGSQPVWFDNNPGDDYTKTPHIYWGGEENGWVALDYGSNYWQGGFESREDAVQFYDQPSDYSLYDGVNEMLDGFDAVTLVGGVVRMGARHGVRKVVSEGGELLLEKTSLQIMRDSAEKELRDAGRSITKIAVNGLVGKAAERVAKEVLEKEGFEVLASNIAIRVSDGPSGLRFVDHLVKAPGGEIVAYEIKSGNGVRNTAQRTKDQIMETVGGSIVGSNAPVDLRGTTRKIRTIELKIK